MNELLRVRIAAEKSAVVVVCVCVATIESSVIQKDTHICILHIAYCVLRWLVG